MFIIKEGTPADKVGEGTSQEVIDSVTKFLEKSGYAVRTKEQETSYLASKEQEAINKVISERNTQMEATIFETTGIPKTQGEKFHEYHKRAIVEKTKDIDALKTKLSDLEKTGLSGSDLAKQYKDEVENLRGQIKTINDEWTSKFNEKNQEVFGAKVSSEMDKVIAKIRAQIDPTIRPELVDDLIQARLNKFRQDFKPVDFDGNIAFKDKDGKTKTSHKDGKIETFEEIFAGDYLKGLVDPQRQQGGAGSGGGQGGNGGAGGSAKWKDYVRPDTVKTKIQLTDYLQKELKLDASTKEFTEAFTAFDKDSEGKPLPLK